RRSRSGARSPRRAGATSRASGCSPARGSSAPVARRRSAWSRCAPATWSAITPSSSAASASGWNSSTARRAASVWRAARWARLAEAAGKPANHRYPDYEGLLAFRQAAAEWMAQRYGVRVDPATEVVSLIGSKEGIANMAVAFVDPGDIVLVPDPGYPVYHIG